MEDLSSFCEVINICTFLRTESWNNVSWFDVNSIYGAKICIVASTFFLIQYYVFHLLVLNESIMKNYNFNSHNFVECSQIELNYTLKFLSHTN